MRRRGIERRAFLAATGSCAAHLFLTLGAGTGAAKRLFAAATRTVSSESGLPTSSAAASSAEEGSEAIEPRTMRADSTISPAIFSATATESTP